MMALRPGPTLLLCPAQLEEMRLLTNSGWTPSPRAAGCCSGSGPSRRRVKLGAFAAFDQRITLRYDLEGMDLAETQGYLKRHLQLAGRSDPLFVDAAVA